MKREGLSDLLRIRRHFAGTIRFELEDETDVVVRVAGGDMKVEMKHGLTCDTTIVGKQVEAFESQRLNHAARDALGDMNHLTEVRLLNGEEILTVGPGNDQGMPEMNRIDVQNGDYPRGFQKNFRGELAATDRAKRATARLGLFVVG